MKRIYALAISMVVLLATPALATADITGRSAMNQQAVNYVIARALAQRGVPFSYGGGDANGPTAGNPVANAMQQPEQLSNGLASQPLASGIAVDAAPKPVGFDASGLMVYAFAGVGIKLPRSSGEQYKVGQKILPQQALPGDLIFYGPEGTQSVAMFLGNGQMLQATDPVVVVTPVRTNDMAPYLSRMIA
jgi:cell wall-associated NlpC family hydrolase